MRTAAHDERCKKCKETVAALLHAVYGQVEKNVNLKLPTRLDDFAPYGLLPSLTPIHEALQKHRGFEIFVRGGWLSGIDFYIRDRKMIVEFDESQHFTEPRGLTLAHYPADAPVAFPVERWRVLCHDLKKRDNDPPLRDEQRAWYDTIRDFAPRVLGGGRTHRLYARDRVWCSMNPGDPTDRATFEQLLVGGTPA